MALRSVLRVRKTMSIRWAVGILQLVGKTFRQLSRTFLITFLHVASGELGTITGKKRFDDRESRLRGGRGGHRWAQAAAAPFRHAV
eukprot:scaffold1355_cov268-Pinguiococcus_pyrenoidosus.AAC.30